MRGRRTPVLSCRLRQRSGRAWRSREQVRPGRPRIEHAVRDCGSPVPIGASRERCALIAAPLCWEGPSRHAWTHPANLTAGVTARTAATCGDTSAYGSRNLLSAYKGIFNLVARRTESLTPNGEHIWVCPVVARLFAEERTAAWAGTSEACACACVVAAFGEALELCTHAV